MSASLAPFCALVLLAAAPVQAHRLDEYLLATTIAVEKGRVQVELRLAPGVAVFPIVFAGIDSDSDDIASPAEQRSYAERVIGDLSLTADGMRLPLRLVASTFAPKELLQEGRGEIQLVLAADVPAGAARRRLTFENHHRREIGVYLVNGLVPRDPDIQLAAQQRNQDQTVYRLDYTDASAPAGVSSFASWSETRGWIGAALMALIAGLALIRRLASGPIFFRRHDP